MIDNLSRYNVLKKNKNKLQICMLFQKKYHKFVPIEHPLLDSTEVSTHTTTTIDTFFFTVPYFRGGNPENT